MRDFTPEEVERHDELVTQAWSLIDNELLLHERPLSRKPNWFARRKLRAALDKFQEALEINPESWPSMWGVGKIYQRLQQREEALSWFSRAFSIAPNQKDVAREAGVEALFIGKSEEAIYFCESAIRLSSNDAGFVANLAWAYLIAGRVEDAQIAIGNAVNADPQDQISRTVAKIIGEVASGKRPIPKSLAEIMGSA